MGITVTEELTFNNGLTNNGSYGSFGASELHLHKTTNEDGDTVFVLICDGRLWASKDFRNSNTSSILRKDRVSVTLTPDQLNGNLYALLYAEWKNSFSSVSDDN